MGYSEGSFRPVPGALRRACATLIVVLVSCVALAQGGALGPPAPDAPAWGAYRAGLGYPVFSDDLLARAAHEGIDPRCLMTITIAWEAHPRIAANVAAGLLEVLVEGVSRAEAQAVLMEESPYFNADIDCVGLPPTPSSGGTGGSPPASWMGGNYTTTYGEVDFGAGASGRGSYEGGKSAILYTLDGRTMTGFWVEPSSAQRCESTVEGSEYWGWIFFEFDEEFASWSGSWGYCDGDTSGSWTGSRKE